MKEITIETIAGWKPCRPYQTKDGAPSNAKIKKGLGGRDSVTPLEVCSLEIPPEDRLWVLLRKDVLDEKELHLLACLFAEHVQPKDADPRSLEAIRIKRLWIDGNATDEELAVARRDAVDAAVFADAVYDAAVEAAAYAAADAAYADADAVADAVAAAAHAAVAAVARKKESKWQIEQVRQILLERNAE